MNGPPLAPVRQQTIDAGITINALVIKSPGGGYPGPRGEPLERFQRLPAALRKAVQSGSPRPGMWIKSYPLNQPKRLDGMASCAAHPGKPSSYR